MMMQGGLSQVYDGAIFTSSIIGLSYNSLKLRLSFLRVLLMVFTLAKYPNHKIQYHIMISIVKHTRLLGSKNRNILLYF